MKEQTSEKFDLFWLCNETGRKHPAGVAFFNETQGDYRLKVDIMPEDKLIFLKVSSMHEDLIRFRVETAVRKAGRITHRAEIGVGRAKSHEGYPVFMDIGPFSRTLVLERAA